MNRDHPSDVPETAFPIAGDDLTALASRLTTGAEQTGLLDIAYDTVDSPIGPLLLAATEHGLIRLAFEREGFDAVLEGLAVKVSPRILREQSRVEPAAGQLAEYFAGRRRRFELVLDHRLSSGFRESVQRFLPTIAYGRTLTYKELADAVGNPNAVRAVGSACATNPHPVVVPCHRVLRSDGGLGGYLGGEAAKRMLLAFEAAA